MPRACATRLARAKAETALAAVKLDLPRRHFFVLQHKERYASRAAEAFIALASEQAGREAAGA